MIEDFPLFRKYSNNKNYFKIMSSNEFIEISVIGNKVVLKKIEAKIYPDKLFISDLINCNQPILKISKEEFSIIENQINTKN
jgi:uncharacterized pyridoxamine 5'-phosphate oxidase family protein